MNVKYTVDGVAAGMWIPADYLLIARAEDLAELAASDFWRNHAAPASTCQVHLEDVEGADLGNFEVRSLIRPMYEAKAVVPR